MKKLLLFVGVFLFVVIVVVYTNFFKASSLIKEDVLNDYSTAKIHCPVFSVETLQLGMKDTVSDKRISELQLFLLDYFKDTIEKELITIGTFDEYTMGFVQNINSMIGSEKDYFDINTKVVINTLCGDAGIRPKISNLELYSNFIKSGESTLLSFEAENFSGCSLLNYTEAIENQNNFFGSEISANPLNSNSYSSIHFDIRLSPVKSSVYQLSCNYDYANESDGTTQVVKWFSIKVE